MERLMTTGEASEVLGISAASLNQLRYLGTGPLYVQVTARQVRYRLSELEAYVERKTRTGTADAALSV